LQVEAAAPIAVADAEAGGVRVEGGVRVGVRVAIGVGVAVTCATSVGPGVNCAGGTVMIVPGLGVTRFPASSVASRMARRSASTGGTVTLT